MNQGNLYVFYWCKISIKSKLNILMRTQRTATPIRTSGDAVKTILSLHGTQRGGSTKYYTSTIHEYCVRVDINTDRKTSSLEYTVYFNLTILFVRVPFVFRKTFSYKFLHIYFYYLLLYSITILTFCSFYFHYYGLHLFLLLFLFTVLCTSFAFCSFN